jgi:hypothetical protein
MATWRFFSIILALAVAMLAPVAGLSRGAEYVLHISVDGLRPSYLQDAINNGDAPNFERFLLQGATTMNARTDYTHTITLPNHATMLTSRPVLQPPGMPDTVHHGYTDNGEPPSTTTLHNYRNPDLYISSTFDVAHDAGLSTAHYASKSKFILFEQSYNAANGAPHPNGSDKIDWFFAQENASAVMQTQILTQLPVNQPNYTFIHYADPDIIGHNSGWGSSQYMDAIATVDGYLGDLIDMVENDTTFAGRTAIVLSSDHGGISFSHTSPSQPANYTIPFFVWGAGVAHGDLYAFNSDTRSNPGTTRPDYNAAGQPIRNGDGGNLALDLLGLGPIPGAIINAAQNLRVTAPGDFNADGIVDAADYAEWRKRLGTTFAQSDYDTWSAHFGESAGSGSAGAAIPEPDCLSLVVLAVLVNLFRHRALTLYII